MTRPAPSFTLAAALRLQGHEHLALVGAGGKTRTLFTLAHEMAPALAATTTHLAVDEAARADAHWVWDPHLTAAAARAALERWDRRGVLLVTGPEQGGRWTATPALDALQDWARDQGLPVLIEADGAARRDLKAPAAHEPAWPPQADGVLVLAHAGALGQPLDATRVQRPEIFAARAGLAPGARLTVDAVARVLLHPLGPTRGAPRHAWVRAVLRAEEPLAQARAGRLARALLTADSPYAAAVVVTTRPTGRVRPLAVEEPRAGVVLAAGGARRFGGRAKVLLSWQGEPLVRRTARAALEAGLHPVAVVVGAHRAAVQAAVDDLPVIVVPNPAWAEGLASSVRAAVQAAASWRPRPAALTFFPADHPYLPPTLAHALVEAHAATLAPIVAPLVMERQRGQPVLFDRVTFADLAALQGDVGGRALMRRYPVHGVPWFDEAVLYDVDTLEDWIHWQSGSRS